MLTDCGLDDARSICSLDSPSRQELSTSHGFQVSSSVLFLTGQTHSAFWEGPRRCAQGDLAECIDTLFFPTLRCIGDTLKGKAKIKDVCRDLSIGVLSRRKQREQMLT